MKSPMQIEAEQQKSQQDKEMGQIVALGRFFEATIDDFIKTNGDISGKVVFGAIDYIMKMYKERMAVCGENYGQLKQIVEKEGFKIHEPYSNDGVDMKQPPIKPSEILMPR